MTRWVCPSCGSGVNAPERPRKNDVRRYCLRCSERTGLLVERSSPVLERRRAVAALRTRERAASKRERAREAKKTSLTNARGETVRVDLVAETRRALREMGYRRPADVEVTVRRRSDPFTSGRAYPWEDRVVLSVGRGAGSYEGALVLVYHEAAHLVADSDARDPRGRNWHGIRFQRTLADALQARWPWVVYGSLSQRSGYAPGDQVRDQLRDFVAAGGEL